VPKTAHDAFDAGQQDEMGGMQVHAEHRCGVILVDDGFDALQLIASAHHRHAAAATAIDDDALVDQPADDVDLDDALRARARHDAAHAAAGVVAHHPTLAAVRSAASRGV
jgi:hypothetical protein